MSVIRNFKMSLYLELSLKLQGKWIALLILLLACTISLGSYTRCYLMGDMWSGKCNGNNVVRTIQILIIPTLACCLLILSDLTTTKLQKKISELRTRAVADQESTGPSVIEVQMNNFFPNQHGGGQNCCSARDHVRSVHCFNQRKVIESL